MAEAGVPNVDENIIDVVLVARELDRRFML
jgi:hypothetical protein